MYDVLKGVYGKKENKFKISSKAAGLSRTESFDCGWYGFHASDKFIYNIPKAIAQCEYVGADRYCVSLHSTHTE